MSAAALSTMVDKKTRRGQADILALRRAITDIVDEHRQLTVRLSCRSRSWRKIQITARAHRSRMRFCSFAREAADWRGGAIVNVESKAAERARKQRQELKRLRRELRRARKRCGNSAVSLSDRSEPRECNDRSL
jgi:hypothetical protein